MGEVTRRRRDPEARRRSIAAAAAELIVEVGADGITHRLVAARAGVPLGATTQYFDTLDDLRTAAFGVLAAEVDGRLEGVRSVLESQGVSPAVLATLIIGSLDDARAVQADRAVVTAAVHDPRLRELARHLSEQLTGMLAPTYGDERALAATIFIDGLMWSAQIRDTPLDRPFIETALTRILGEPASVRPTAHPAP